MSQRQAREDHRRTVASSKNLPVASKCLAIVLLPQKKHGSKSSHSQDVNKDHHHREISGAVNNNSGTSTNNHTEPHGGKEILDDFKQQNETCYWNPALIESIRQLEYLGFVEPCTVLVSGEDIHLENLRSAWGRRVLKAPTNYTIDRIGDVNGIEMQVIPQTQFIPLPDSLCLIITELNNASHPATLESIRTRLQRWYSNTNLPSHQLIYDTLGHLIRERKVFHDGSGYCVVTPEMYHMPATTTDPTSTASWLPYHPMYIPVFPPQQQQHPPYRAPTRSISCQVTQIEDKSSESSHQVEKEKKKSRPRSHSVRACRGKDRAAQAEKENAADFKRSASTRFKTEKAKAMTKDLNLKTSNLNQDKDKGEKASIFSKIFGRKKKKQSTSAGTGTGSTTSAACSQSTEAEFVTFSAQFPPPEWLWYQQQLERQRRTEEWVTQQLPKSATWGHLTGASVLPSSGRAEGGSMQTAMTESSHPYSQYPTHSHPLTSRSQGHVYATLGHMQGVSAADAVRGGREDERKMKQQHRMSGSHVRKGHGHHHHHQREREHHHHPKHRDHRKTLQENNYDVPVSHTQNYGMMGAPPHSQRTDHVAPYSLEENNIYSTPGPSQYGQSVPWHSTPCYDVPPSQFDSVVMPSQIVHNSTAQQEHSEAGKAQSVHNPQHQRKSHRSKRHKGHKQYGMFDAGTASNDISIEYKGRMPKKNSTVAQSRDSGVNCMGLPQNRQHHLEEAELHVTQEASAYLPSRADHHPTLSNTATASSLHPDTVSTQRGTPYTSMEQRYPEGCSQHQPIINNIVNSISDMNSQLNSPELLNSDDITHRDSGPSGASAGGEEEEERGKKMVREDSRGIVREDSRGLVREDSRGLVKGDSRGVVREDSRGLVREDSQSLVREDSSGLVSEDSRGLVREDSRGLVREDSSGLVREDSRSLVREDSSGLVSEDSRGLVREDSSGLVREDSRGLVKGDSRGVVKEDSRGLVREDSRGLVRADSRGLVREDSRHLMREDSRSLIHQQDEAYRYSHLEMRSEGEGVSQNTSPQYMTMCGDAIRMQQTLDPDTTPQYVAMSYCDSSIGEEGAGGGEVLLCQAEINQFQVPQLVLDTEGSLDRGNISSEPDIALSSAGSKDTLDRTADESERSGETVIRSPQFAAFDSQNSYELRSTSPREADFQNSDMSEMVSDVAQQRFTDSQDATQLNGTTMGDATLSGQGGGEGQAEHCVVSALGSEFREMGVVDSGFSSPRNNDDKENQQQQQVKTAAGKKSRYHHHIHNHNHNNVAPVSEVAEEVPTPEPKSKHERIKAFVKQTNQLLEQQQFTGHGNSPFTGVVEYSSEVEVYANYPLPAISHPPPQQHPHQHTHYAPFVKPVHPMVTQHQQVTSQPPPPPPVVLNNQKNHPHHHHPAPRPHSMHDGLKERPKSQNVWQGQGQSHVQGPNGEKMSAKDLRAFQEQQHRGKKFGINGEFEVVGVV
ncbi:uncharacterized protein [Littorina saxatilis]|uniref:Winged helix Storkhead-box1 domain-containing protein n=1 Tax=Littorina saxatilis TaxID=31220 RepID=A0AAN9BUN9_9CAEN